MAKGGTDSQSVEMCKITQGTAIDKKGHFYGLFRNSGMLVMTIQREFDYGLPESAMVDKDLEHYSVSICCRHLAGD